MLRRQEAHHDLDPLGRRERGVKRPIVGIRSLEVSVDRSRPVLSIHTSILLGFSFHAYGRNSDIKMTLSNAHSREKHVDEPAGTRLPVGAGTGARDAGDRP